MTCLKKKDENNKPNDAKCDETWLLVSNLWAATAAFSLLNCTSSTSRSLVVPAVDVVLSSPPAVLADAPSPLGETNGDVEFPRVVGLMTRLALALVLAFNVPRGVVELG